MSEEIALVRSRFGIQQREPRAAHELDEEQRPAQRLVGGINAGCLCCRCHALLAAKASPSRLQILPGVTMMHRTSPGAQGNSRRLAGRMAGRHCPSIRAFSTARHRRPRARGLFVTTMAAASSSCLTVVQSPAGSGRGSAARGVSFGHLRCENRRARCTHGRRSMVIQKVLIPPVANASLESQLRARLRHIDDPSGPLDPLERLAVQAG